MKLEVFDPPMCCSSGICGDNADSKLVVFASDLEWLKAQGIEVVRHGISFEPMEFSKNESVKKILDNEGESCLPIIVVNNKIKSTANYPSRKKLALMCDIEFNEEEAPPIHREENCCCGVDCDCRLSGSDDDSITDYNKCDCTNSPAEDNCTCTPEYDFEEPFLSSKLKKILFVIIILIILGIILIRSCCTVGGT